MGVESAAGREPPRWPLEKAWQWYDAQPWLVGVIYIPSTAINTTEMWQKHLLAQPLGPEELALLLTRGTEGAAAAGEGDQNAAPTLGAPQAGEAVLE